MRRSHLYLWAKSNELAMGESTIDEVVEDGNGNVILLLRQIAPWENSQVLEQLQSRLNGYIDVVNHGVLYEKYPDLKGKPVYIRLLCTHKPPVEIGLKFERVNNTLANMNIGFEIMHIEVADPTKRKDRIKEAIISLVKRLRGRKGRL